MIKRFQPLTKLTWRDRLTVTFWIAMVAPILVVPAQFVLELILGLIAAVPFLSARSFAATMENKGTDDPVYKKNLQRLIERNRRFEDARKARHEPHS